MQVDIAKEAVVRYNTWKAEQQQDSNRFLGLLGGPLETPDEDFAQTAAAEYISSSISIEALSGFIGSVTALSGLFGSLVAMTASSSVITCGYMGSAFLAYMANETIAFSSALTPLASYGSELAALGISTSALGTVSGIASGVIFAIAGSVTRGLQVANYDKVEDRYANLVSDAQNLDINTLINGDDAAQGRFLDFLLMAALR